MLDLDDDAALAATGVGGIRVDGGIVVNSDDAAAVLLSNGATYEPTRSGWSGDQLAEQRGAAPAGRDRGRRSLDPLADLPPPDELPIPPPPAAVPGQDVTTTTTLTPGVYEHITVENGATLTLEEGVRGHRLRPPSTPGSGCWTAAGWRATASPSTWPARYPAPCDGDAGTRFRLDPGSEFEVDPPAAGESAYAGLSVFADPGNTRSQQLYGTVTLAGAVYAASARLVVFPTADVQVNSPGGRRPPHRRQPPPAAGRLRPQPRHLRVRGSRPDQLDRGACRYVSGS